ncbi:hypothetical protein Tco_1561890 [Tanacetum coccineum]
MTLVVKSDSGASRLKVISCIKARKYIERGSQLFLAQVTKKEPSKKQLQDVPVIRNFPKVFPDDLLGLPPPRQVEFRIELVPRAAPVVQTRQYLSMGDFGTDISQKDEKPSKKRQNRTRDGKVCEDEAQSKSSQLREEKAKKNIT